NAGTFTVGLRVTDSSTLTSSASATVVVSNAPPVAELVNDGPVGEGGVATVSFRDVLDSNADVAAGFRYSFDFNNDGDFTDAVDLNNDGDTDAAGEREVLNGTSDSVAVPLGWLTDPSGVNHVRGRITDQDGASLDLTTDVVVLASAPKDLE